MKFPIELSSDVREFLNISSLLSGEISEGFNQ